MRWTELPPWFRFAIYAIFLTILVLLLGSYALALDRQLGWTLPQTLSWLGLLLFIGGAILAGWCVWLFLTAGQGTPAPFDPPRKFVVRGPYLYVRNPMMLGGLTGITGAALYLSSPAILLTAIGLFIAVNIFILLWEEPDLERRFGEAYRQYKAAVPRWIPRVPK
ncbi:MAG: isoprenylcysteine carboxylmethyltransferase family protein [Chloroflexi bacterium]|nr:isoprenylcysteine carboxylmethyltransferase family protein [Chloroflexota bacterium]